METFLAILVLLPVVWFIASIINAPSSKYHQTQAYRNQIAGKVGRSLGRSITGRGPRRWRL